MKGKELAVLAVIALKPLPEFETMDRNKYPGDGVASRSKSTISRRERKKRTARKKAAKQSKKQNRK